MEIFFEDVWGNSSAVRVTEFPVGVPKSLYYIDLQYWCLAAGKELSQSKLTGILKSERRKRFVNVQLAGPLP